MSHMSTYFVFGIEHLFLSPSLTEVQISTHVGANQDLTHPKNPQTTTTEQTNKQTLPALPLIH